MHFDCPHLLIRNFHDHLTLLHMLVGKELLDVIDRCSSDTRLMKTRQHISLAKLTDFTLNRLI